MTPQHMYLEAVSIAAPGLEHWDAARAVLRDESVYAYQDLSPSQTSLLPPNERRRASATVRMGFRVAEAACAASSVDAASLATVFVSADGDLQIAQRLCVALAQTPRLISPTDFHNSVHNAAAGYWGIAVQAKGPSTAMAAGDHSFATGLLETLCMVAIEQQPTLLVAYDIPAPQPLQSKRPVTQPFGTAWIFTPQPTTRSQAMLTLQLQAAPASTLRNEMLETLRLANPAARSLPLLQALALQNESAVYLDRGRDAALRCTFKF